MDIYDSRYFLINKKLLISFGLWPYQNYEQKLFIRILITIVMYVMMVPQILQVYLHIGNTDKIIEHVSVIIFILIAFAKLFTAIIHEKKLDSLYSDISRNWEIIKDPNERNILIDYSERGRILTLGYIAYMIAGWLAFDAIPMLPKVLNILKPLNVSRPQIFILDGELFIDRNKYYIGIYILESLCTAVSVGVMTAFDSMYAVSVEHCLGLFAIINFTDVLASTYSSSFLVLVGGTMILLSFECVLMLIKSDQIMELIRYGFVLFGAIGHLFFLSWPGQKLIDHSASLFEDGYNNEWYESSIESQKLLAFLTLRSKKPCYLTAGGIYVMNFANFAMTIKTSLSYMTVFSSLR